MEFNACMCVYKPRGGCIREHTHGVRNNKDPEMIYYAKLFVFFMARRLITTPVLLLSLPCLVTKEILPLSCC